MGGDVKPLDQHVDCICIYTIGVESKPGEFDDSKQFTPRVDFDLKVVQPDVRTLSELHM